MQGFKYQDGKLVLYGISPAEVQGVLMRSHFVLTGASDELGHLVRVVGTSADAAPRSAEPDPATGNGTAVHNPPAAEPPAPPAAPVNGATAAPEPPAAPTTAGKGRRGVGPVPAAETAPAAPGAPPADPWELAPAGANVNEPPAAKSSSSPAVDEKGRPAAPAAKTNGKAAPAAPVSTGDVDMELVKGMAKLKDILRHFMDRGVAPKACAALCKQLRAEVPLLGRIQEAEIEGRVTRTLEVMDPGEQA